MLRPRPTVALIAAFFASGLMLVVIHTATPAAPADPAPRRAAPPTAPLKPCDDPWDGIEWRSFSGETEPTEFLQSPYRGSFTATINWGLGTCPVCQHACYHGRVWDHLSPKRGRIVSQQCACRWDDELQMAVWPKGPGTYPQQRR